MLADVVDLLRCPHCGGGLALAGGTVRCEAGHSFDVARQGYLSLLPGDAQLGTADTAAMVEARAAFLEAGHYAPIVAAVAAECERAVANAVEGEWTAAGATASGRVRDRPVTGCVVDVGAGTGHHLAAALERLPDRVGLALDVSKHALRRAARAHPRIGAVGCDAWRPLPVRDGVAAVALSVFAPRDGAELARILGPTGTLIVVTPTARHLEELVSALDLLTVDARKQERLGAKLKGHFAPAGERIVEERLALPHEELAALVTMGPSAAHLDAGEIAARVKALPEPFGVTASVALRAYCPV